MSSVFPISEKYKLSTTFSTQTGISMYSTAISDSKTHSEISASISENYKLWKTLSAQTAQTDISMYTTAISYSKIYSEIQGSISEKYKLLTTLSHRLIFQGTPLQYPIPKHTQKYKDPLQKSISY